MLLIKHCLIGIDSRIGIAFPHLYKTNSEFNLVNFVINTVFEKKGNTHIRIG